MAHFWNPHFVYLKTGQKTRINSIFSLNCNIDNWDYQAWSQAHWGYQDEVLFYWPPFKSINRLKTTVSSKSSQWHGIFGSLFPLILFLACKCIILGSHGCLWTWWPRAWLFVRRPWKRQSRRSNESGWLYSPTNNSFFKDLKPRGGIITHFTFSST